jgi:hypothetical protein
MQKRLGTEEPGIVRREALCNQQMIDRHYGTFAFVSYRPSILRMILHTTDLNMSLALPVSRRKFGGLKGS